MQSRETAILLQGSDSPDELQSRVGELEDEVKDLELVANLSEENMALTTNLEASRKVERQQQEEIASLKERLLQALRAQVNIHFWNMHALFGSLLGPFPCVQQDTATQEQMLSKTRESQLEDKIKMLEETRSDLEEIASLKERLLQALRARVNIHFWNMHALFGSLLGPFPCVQQDTATQEQMLSKTRESQLEDKIKMLEETRSDLEAEVEKLEKQLKQLEILPSDIEQLKKVHVCICLLFLCVCVILFPTH